MDKKYMEKKYMHKKYMDIKDMTLIAMFVAIISVCSWISIPVGTVPFTLQTLAVFVTAGVLGTKRSVITILVYIVLGLIGVPVFTQFKAGPHAIVGPTGGYLIGFIFMVIAIGEITKMFPNKNQSTRNMVFLVSMIVGDVLCFIAGTIHFMHVMKMDLAGAIAICIIPYIIPDILKMLMALPLIARISKYIGKY